MKSKTAANVKPSTSSQATQSKTLASELAQLGSSGYLTVRSDNNGQAPSKPAKSSSKKS